jgi:transposase
MTSYRRDHNSGRTEGIRGYSHNRNSVDELTFELLKSVPENLPLHQQLDENFLRGLVEQHPRATLQQYCQMIQQRHGITLSPQTMCKLLARIGMNTRMRFQLATAPSKALAA